MQTIPQTKDILKKALNGERLALEEGVRLFEESGLEELGTAANAVRQRRHP